MFIYRTHAADPNQLSGGIYGAPIVVEPGKSFDAEHERLLVIGTRDTFFDATRITINGMEKPQPAAHRNRGALGGRRSRANPRFACSDSNQSLTAT